MSVNFRLELIEPSAREVKGQHFLKSEAVSRCEPCSLLLSSLAPGSSLSTRVQKVNTSLADVSVKAPGEN